ncbi:uncharacterized protein LOC110026344 [Phalaenopsis equestris]|uniref:uncharacterized protein LOC110026344 n=1 Tax=Phalaenopsis equestris TaxID=78828 RepID=UPI0009E64F00|nr:uncharacterized protein LOC110026344 [Phalaenopsis equestris]
MVGYAFHYKSKMMEEKNGKKKKKKKPSWLELLLETKFFGACAEHQGIKKKSEINIYCVDCNESMCSFCVSSPSSSHRYHCLLQIRRYIYQNVIRIRDMQKFTDCSGVQPYIVNGAKVVLLNPKMQSKPSKSAVAATSFCKSCRRTVAEHNGYCSIACKVFEEMARSPELDGGCSPAKLEGLELSPEEEEEEEERAFSIGSLEPSDWGVEDLSPCIELPTPNPKLRAVRRKGTPRRSPIF